METQFYISVYVTVKTISDLNKVVKICFGTQLQRVQALVFGFTDPGLGMVQTMMVAGDVWQRLLSPQEYRKQRQRHGEVEKDTSKDTLHSSPC